MGEKPDLITSLTLICNIKIQHTKSHISKKTPVISLKTTRAYRGGSSYLLQVFYSQLHKMSEGVNIINVVVSGTQFWPVHLLYPSVYSLQLIQFRTMVALEPIPADTGRTLDMLLVCHSANTDPNNHLYSHSYLQPKQPP